MQRYFCRSVLFLLLLAFELASSGVSTSPDLAQTDVTHELKPRGADVSIRRATASQPDYRIVGSTEVYGIGIRLGLYLQAFGAFIILF